MTCLKGGSRSLPRSRREGLQRYPSKPTAHHERHQRDCGRGRWQMDKDPLATDGRASSVLDLPTLACPSDRRTGTDNADWAGTRDPCLDDPGRARGHSTGRSTDDDGHSYSLTRSRSVSFNRRREHFAVPRPAHRRDMDGNQATTCATRSATRADTE